MPSQHMLARQNVQQVQAWVGDRVGAAWLVARVKTLAACLVSLDVLTISWCIYRQEGGSQGSR